MRKLGSSISVGLCLAFFGGQALAQSECESNDDCSAGMACEVVGTSGCPGAPECKPGEDCPDVEPCESEEFMGCVPAPCETDADCGADMVCHTETWESCSGSAGMSCDEEGNCEIIEEEPVCESGSESRCAYRWQEECEADADCGDGFTCEQREAGCDCAVSGGGSVDPVPADMPMEGGGSAGDPGTDEGGMTDGDMAEGSDGDAEDPPERVAPDMVECDCGEPETIGMCIADEIECESNADCPESWTCEAGPEVVCGGGTEPSMGGDDAEPPPDGAPPADGDAEQPDEDVAVDGGVPPEGAEEQAAEAEVVEDLPTTDDCVPVSLPSMCVPPGGGYYGTDDSAGAPTAGEDPREEAGDGDGTDNGGAAPPEEDDADDEPAEEPTDDNGADDDEAPGEDDPATDEEDEDEDDAAEEEEDDGEGGNEGVDSDSGDDGGCSVKAPGRQSPSALWLTGLLGLLVFRRRK
jgi:MYXO-CTERM domain-containing protein